MTDDLAALAEVLGLDGGAPGVKERMEILARMYPQEIEKARARAAGITGGPPRVADEAE